MSQHQRTGRPVWRGRRGVLVVATLLSTAVLASACTSKSGGTGTAAGTLLGTPSTTPSTTSSAPAGPAVITAVQAGSRLVNPAKPITVTVAQGTFTGLTMLTPDGKQVTGAFSADKTSWHTTEDLGYGRTYSVTAQAANSLGAPTSKAFTLTTLTPANQTMPYLQRAGGYTLNNGATYGIGIVPVVHFDEPVTDKAAAEGALIVTATPAVSGVWDWTSNTDAHFRPRTYWKPGTKVTVTAKVYGVNVGGGIYGQADQSVSFRIGDSHIAIADDTTHQVNVYFNGKLAKTMPTSMGRHSGETVNGNYISFYTMDGTYTVLEHDNPAIMSSASYGLPATAPGGYPDEPIYYSTKISVDGIYLHELDATVWAQGNTDVSHGCLNLSEANASWYYNHSLIGDVVEVKNNGGPTIAQWQNGDWSVPWATWVKGSALH